MTKLAWASDLHLDFAHSNKVADFIENVNDTGADGVIITGDISNYNELRVHLEILDKLIDMPIYFLLGNHDSYGGSITEAKVIAFECSNKVNNLYYLDHNTCKPFKFDNGAYLIGTDGWADGRAADFYKSRVVLTDYRAIAELKMLSQKYLLKKLNSLGDQHAGVIRGKLKLVKDKGDVKKLIIATHVPPWREAAWHEGEHSDDQWAPHFVCIAVGKVIEEFAAKNKDIEILVLCGHSHGEGESQIADNLVVRTAAARYRNPAVFDVIDL